MTMRPTRLEEQDPPRDDAPMPWWRKVPLPPPPGTPIPDPDAPFGAPVDYTDYPWRPAA